MALQSVISLTAVISSTIVTASPLPTIYQLYKRGTPSPTAHAHVDSDHHNQQGGGGREGGMSMPTFVGMLLNNALSLWYGYYLGLAPMIAQRAAASVLSIAYILVILRYGNKSNKKLREDLLWLFGFITIIIFLSFDVFYYRRKSSVMEAGGQSQDTTTDAQKPDLIKRDLGVAFGLASAFFNASPLLGLREVRYETLCLILLQLITLINRGLVLFCSGLPEDGC
eukprot:gb/GECG01007503.1/.p1 GENE.gb/GECG01007503.1/~~gb/GECG01007503.1/.p1  ORF type:complete len:225 (+),score=21.00 gb/GECG01007503.1/:1-675(+)